MFCVFGLYCQYSMNLRYITNFRLVLWGFLPRAVVISDDLLGISSSCYCKVKVKNSRILKTI